MNNKEIMEGISSGEEKSQRKQFLGDLNLPRDFFWVEGLRREEKCTLFERLTEQLDKIPLGKVKLDDPRTLRALCSYGQAALALDFGEIPIEKERLILSWRQNGYGFPQALFYLTASANLINGSEVSISRGDRLTFRPTLQPESPVVFGVNPDWSYGQAVYSNQGEIQKTFLVPEAFREPFIKFFYLIASLPKEQILKISEEYTRILEEGNVIYPSHFDSTFQFYYEVLHSLNLVDHPHFSRLTGIVEDVILEEFFYENSRFTSKARLKKIKADRGAMLESSATNKERPVIYQDVTFWTDICQRRNRLQAQAERVPKSQAVRMVGSWRKSLAETGKRDATLSIYQKATQIEQENRRLQKMEEEKGLRLLEERLLPEELEDRSKYNFYQGSEIRRDEFVFFCFYMLNFFSRNPALVSKVKTLSSNFEAFSKGSYGLSFEKVEKDPFLCRVFVAFCEGDLQNLAEEKLGENGIPPGKILFSKFLAARIAGAACQDPEIALDLVFGQKVRLNPFKYIHARTLFHSTRSSLENKLKLAYAQWNEDRDQLMAVTPQSWDLPPKKIVTVNAISRSRKEAGDNIYVKTFGLRRTVEKTKTYLERNFVGNEFKRKLKRAVVAGVVAITFLGSAWGGSEVLKKARPDLFSPRPTPSGERKRGETEVKREMLKKLPATFYGRIRGGLNDFKSGENLGFKNEELISYASEREVRVGIEEGKSNNWRYEANRADFYYPPEGWNITSIRGEKGASLNSEVLPLIMGGVQVMDVIKLGEKVEITVQRDQGERVSPGIKILEDRSLLYDPQVYRDDIAKTEQMIGIESNLGLIIRGFKEAVFEWQAKKGSREEISDLTIEHLQKLGSYVSSQRFYSLEDIPEGEKALEYLARKENQGYYCEEAYEMTAKFLDNFGIKVLPVIGRDLLVFQEGQLYSRNVHHIKNIVHLPDGRLLLVDFTPPVTVRTSQQDLEALVIVAPNELTLFAYREEIFTEAIKIGVSALFAGAVLLILKKAGKIRKRNQKKEDAQRRRNLLSGQKEPDSQRGEEKEKWIKVCSLIREYGNDIVGRQLQELFIYLAGLPEADLDDQLTRIRGFSSLSDDKKQLLFIIAERQMVLYHDLSDADFVEKLQTEGIFDPSEIEGIAMLSSEELSCLRSLAKAFDQGGNLLNVYAVGKAMKDEKQKSVSDYNQVFLEKLADMIRLIQV